MGNALSDTTERFDRDKYYVPCDEDYEEYGDYALEERADAGGDGVTGDSDGRSQTGAGAATAAATTTGAAAGQEEPADLVLGLCGLEPGVGEWEEVPPEPPIRESRLTDAEKAKFREHLKIIFGEEALRGKRIVFEPYDVVEVMKKVIPYLESESMLIEDVPFDVVVVADLHGQLHDLHRIFEEDAKDGKPAWECMKYVFLGDYVDRGRQSLEIVMALFCIKMMHPERIFLLRGNHEFALANYRYGFPLEIKERYDDLESTKVLYGCINVAFSYLSVAAVVGDKYLCTHAGIASAGMTRKLMRRIPKPYIYSQKDFSAHDMIWSDPAIGLRSTTFNVERGSSLLFGIENMAYALYNMDCIGLFRGHSMMYDGYDIVGNMCISLFSCSGQNNNKGAIAHIGPTGAVVIKVLEIDEARVAWDAELLRCDGGEPDHADEKTQHEHEPPIFVDFEIGRETGKTIVIGQQ